MEMSEMKKGKKTHKDGGLLIVVRFLPACKWLTNKRKCNSIVNSRGTLTNIPTRTQTH